MAEERDLGLIRTDDSGDAEPSKAELQRRMEEARENISQTVAEIKDTVVNQYNAVKESLDWREQFRRRPLAWSVGALSVGLIVGYSVGGVFAGGDEDDEEYAHGLSPEDTRVFELPPSSLESAAPAAPRAYAGHAITGPSYGASVSAEGPASQTYSAASVPRGANMEWSGPEAGSDEEAEAEPQGPGLIERFKQTKAYDKLETEISTLGDRFIEELSRTAQTVVLPLLFNKIKNLVGVDLSGKKQPSGREGGATRTGSADTSTPAKTQAATTAGGATRAQEGGGSDYGSSENRGYGTASA